MFFNRPMQPSAPMQAPSGAPGLSGGAGNITPEMSAMRLTQPETATRITAEDVRRGATILQKYKDGKANLEKRLIEDEQWWELRHWDVIRRTKAKQASPEPTSAWLFNAIISKHADLMDNYPESAVLPRERSDEESARILSDVLPVVMEYNGYEQTYSDNGWEKIKHGTSAFGVFWNRDKDNGLGDVDVKGIDLLKLFWEPGVEKLEDSKNLFITELVDNPTLDLQYPDHAGRWGGGAMEAAQYIHDDTVDNSDKSVVVDWYYHTFSPFGRRLLHYIKFCGDVLLYASENDPQYRDTGWYEDGEYPVVLDTLFPEKGTPVGFGIVTVCKDPQLYIDKLSANIQETAMMATKTRFLISGNTNISEDELSDWTKSIIHAEGTLDDVHCKQVKIDPLPPIYQQLVEQKIEEMKETSSNRDFSNGSSGGGITAASAIAALQEAGNKVSRDMIAASYRAQRKISAMVIERIRQFYTTVHSFRIDSGNGYDFEELDNSMLGNQPTGVDAQGNQMYRRPIFDLKIKAMKRSPFSRIEQNERAKELYGMGFFDPNKAQESVIALEMMDFEGKDKVLEMVQQGQTLMALVQQQAMLIQQLTGAPAEGEAPGAAPGAAPSGGMTGRVMQAQSPQPGYSQQLAGRTMQ